MKIFEKALIKREKQQALVRCHTIFDFGFIIVHRHNLDFNSFEKSPSIIKMIPGFGHVATPQRSLKGDAEQSAAGSRSRWAAAPQQTGKAARLTPVTANFCHAKGCPDPASCWRCLFLRNQEEWEASSPIQADGITIGTWLVLTAGDDAADAGLGCVVCNKAAMDSAFARGTVSTPFLSNIKRRHASLQHQRALKVIGFTNSQQADKDCLGLDVFKQALDHRLNKFSLRQGIGGENPCGREKWCLAESDREITRDFIRRASAIAIAQDGRQNRLLMRFSAKGILGAQEVIGETISNVVVAMERVIERFATPGWGGPCAQEMDSSLREHLRNSVMIFVADAASNEQGAGRVSKSFFPNLVSIQRDRARQGS